MHKTLVALVLLTAATALATTVNEVTLKSLKKVAVMVEELDPAAQQAGITKEGLQTAVELRLRRMGLQVVPVVVAAHAPPVFYVNLNCMLDEDHKLIYSMRIEVQEDVTVVRTKRWVPGASLWAFSTLGFAGRLRYQEAIDRAESTLLEHFENAWLEANPR